MVSVVLRSEAQVSIHAPARGATSCRVITRKGENVSIHAPARGATSLQSERHHHRRFQFTRPQGARRLPMGLMEARNVSIHAPARGATGSTFLIKDLTAVSIHAPARGATITNLIAKANNCVSIHAPARGATQGVRPRARLPDVSIHAPARGATAAVLDSFSHVWFQFTRPQGARPRASSAARRRTCFNSRARKGRDVVFGGTANNKQGFQFTRPQGARRSVVCG